MSPGVYTEVMVLIRITLRRFLLLILLSLSVLNMLGAQDTVFSGSAVPDDKWTVITRWDYRVRIDGKYLGFANRELREVYRRGDALPGGWEVEGEARVLGATKKDGAPVAARLEASEAVSYLLGRDGQIAEAEDGYPRLRGFPSFPDEELLPGDSWEAPLDILVLGPDGERGVLNQIAAYQYLGLKAYGDRPAHYFDVSWAVRYDGYDPDFELFLNKVEGSHKVSLVVDAETLAPIMARDSLSERWIWADSRVEQRDGFALIFWKGVPPLDKGSVLDEFNDRFPGEIVSGGGSGIGNSGGMIGGGTENIVIDGEDSEIDDSSKDIVIVETDRGVSVTLRNLHFKPDLAELLPGDRSLLDELASILTSIPGRTVLVRGHTADVGRPEDEKTLSEERAHTVAEEMTARGVDPRRLIYEGVGAQEPVASNDSEEGRRLNRRVEFLILED